MTLGLSPELDAAFGRATSAVLVNVNGVGHPVAAVYRVAHDGTAGCFELDTGVGLPDPRVALVFADGELVDVVLVQGTAQTSGHMRLRVRPERIYRWAGGNLDGEPELFDAHLEEVRSQHNEEPEVGHDAPAPGSGTIWDERLEPLAALATAKGVLAVVGPDGFPFAVQLPVEVDPGAKRVRCGADPVGAPLDPGPACLLVLDPQQQQILVQGDLIDEGGSWVLRPRSLV